MLSVRGGLAPDGTGFKSQLCRLLETWLWPWPWATYVSSPSHCKTGRGQSPVPGLRLGAAWQGAGLARTAVPGPAAAGVPCVSGSAGDSEPLPVDAWCPNDLERGLPLKLLNKSLSNPISHPGASPPGRITQLSCELGHTEGEPKGLQDTRAVSRPVGLESPSTG